MHLHSTYVRLMAAAGIGLLTSLTTLAQSNIVVSSPASATPGNNNVIVGLEAGASPNMNAGYTVLVGRSAGRNMTVGSYSTFVGGQAGLSNTTGTYNTFIGYYAGVLNSSAINNTFLGAQAGRFNSVGRENMFAGSQAGFNNTTGYNNTYSGYQAGYGSTTGFSNVAYGVRAGYSLQTGRNNVLVGDSAGVNSTVNGNVMVGSKAGYTNTTGVQNTFLGYQAGFTNNGVANTFIGYRSGYSNTTGQFNTFIGVQTGVNNTTGSSNYMMGTNAGLNNTTGSGNYFLGDNAGYYNTTGGYNVYLGANAGNGTGVNGSNNVAIGFESGNANNGGVTNTFIGFRADAAAAGLQNASAFGANAKVTVSNAVVLGATDAIVGIGTTAPTAKLEVASGTTGVSGLKTTNLTSSFVPTATASKFLTVDASGSVILASYASGAREGVDALWERKGQFLQSANGESIVIGRGISKLPSEYNLFVSKGILTEKVKVAVKNAGEWSDYVFAPDYKLTSLPDVKQYIRQHGHLPGVPSADEMVNEGMDVAKMNAKLLEKIEELTLHMIRIEERSQRNEHENRRLKQQVSALRRYVATKK